MVNHALNRPFEILDKLMGGEGEAIKRDLAGIKPVNVRVCSEMTLNGGSSVGFHIHKDETEIYYIISGTAEYSDNDNIVTLTAGDTAICYSGDGHAIKNTSTEPLKFFAIIILE